MKFVKDENAARKNSPNGKKLIKSVSLLLVAVLAVTWVFPSLVKIVSGTAEENDPIARIYSMLTGTLEDPDTAEEYYELANIAIGQQSYDAALGYLSTARSLADLADSAFVSELWLKSASVYALMGNYETAKVCLTSALKLNPESVQALLLNAQLLIEEQDFMGAAAELKKYTDLTPEDTATWQTLAQLYESLGAYEEAAAEYAAMYALNGENDAFLLNALRCGFLGGKYEETLNSFDEYLNANLDADAEYRGVAAFLKAACLMQLGRYSEAVEGFRAAAEEGYDAATCYEQMVMCGYDGGDYEAAVLAGEEMIALELAPSAEDVFYQRMGASMMQLGRYEEAENYLSKSIEINPDLAGNHYYRGVSYLALEELDKAIADFTVSIDDGFMVQYCYYNRGVCYVQKLDYDSALNDFEKTLTSGEDPALIQGAKDILWQLVAYYENQAAITAVPEAQTAETIDNSGDIPSDIPYDEAIG